MFSMPDGTHPALDRRAFLGRGLAAHGALFGLPSWALAPEEAKDQLMESASVEPLYSVSGGMAPAKADMADRIAIRQLIDAWAHCADRRLREKQAGLLAEDGVIENYVGDPATHAPVSVLRGRQELFKALAVLNTFVATTHFNGQSTILVSGDQAFGESYCLAYEITENVGKRSFELLSIRYLDDFARRQGRWFFRKRQLIIDWSDKWTPNPDARRSAAGLVNPLDHVELTQLLNEIVWRVDNRSAATIHELFVEDGSLQVGPTPVIGWKDLSEWGKALDVNPPSGLHVVTNQRFVLNGPDQASGSSTLIAYSAPAEGSSPTTPTVVGVDHDTYVRTASGWRFRSRIWAPAVHSLKSVPRE